MHLTKKGLLMRGNPWRMQKVQILLSDTLYMGEYFTNIRDSKANANRPPQEWIKATVPAIIDAAIFERLRIKREARAPAKTPPRITNSPTLLTGLLKCSCGASMTVATGKGGLYRYYKCTRRKSLGNDACDSKNLPMERLNDLVLNSMADKIFAPERLQAMVSELRKRIRSSKDVQQDRIIEINRQIKQVEKKQENLLNAIENGTIELDEPTQRRAQQHKSAREALFIELAGVRRDHSLPAVEHIKASQVDVFGKVLREKVLAKGSPLAKSYLNILVDEIVVNDKTATIKGSYAALAGAMGEIKRMGTLDQVPTFMPEWRARRDSNSRPPGS